MNIESPREQAAAGGVGRTPRPLSQALVDLSETAVERVSLGEISEALSDRSFAALIILFAAPNLLPLPPGASTVFGIPLILIAAQLVVGMRRLWLPRVLADRSLDRETFTRVATRLQPILHRFERLARPRYWSVSPVFAERYVGLVVLVMSIILALPIPFANWTPSLAVILISLGLTERDGVWIGAGTLVAAASVGILVGVIGTIGFAAGRLMH